ncbi:MAG: undecaprenyldiphospho-muramoylpentapeptide beta-N-acetylglucosaminyltransferase [Cyanobacteria bacterium J06638_28]
MSETPVKLLIAASGTGGHLFPAIATAEHLTDYTIEWLGVPDRLETELVPERYPLHTVRLGGFQGRFGLGTVRLLWQLLQATWQLRQRLQQGQFTGVFTTGGYIAAPAILAARSLGLPTVLHESNALPGKVTRWLSPWCSLVALGFEAAIRHLPQAQTAVVGTPVRSQFLQSATSQVIQLPDDVPVIVVVGGSQGAVAVNQLVRAAAPAWLEAGAWLIHQTGTQDPEADSFNHPHYIHRPFFDAMASLFRRADLVISRAGAGTLTELAFTHTPSLLIPYPFAAEDHQTFNAEAFVDVGAAQVYRQSDLTPTLLQETVLELLNHPEQLQAMSKAAASLAVPDSAEQLATKVRQILNP